MNKRFIALALSLVLSGGSTVTPYVFAATAKAPVLKTAVSQDVSHVELTLGKAQIIKLNMPATRVSISDPEVVGIVLISPTEVQLIGKSVGVANLLVWGEKTGDNYLTIDLSVHRDVSVLARKIQMIDPGINIMPMAAEDAVILTGVAESNEKAQLAYDLAKAFFTDDKAAAAGGDTGGSSNSPGSATFAGTSAKIINLIRVMGQPSTKAEMVQKQLSEIDANIKLNVVPGFGGKEKAILSGRVKNASAVSKAVNLTSIFYGAPGIKVITGPGGNLIGEQREQAASQSFATDAAGGGLVGNMNNNVLQGSIITDTSGNVVSMLEVEERPQVKCTIKFMEVRKDSGFNYASGFQYNQGQLSLNSFTGSTAVPGTEAATFRILGNDLGIALQGLVSQGKARILAEPTITAISGEPATFLAGGEFPIPVSNVNGQVNVAFKEFGIRLNLMATVTDRGTIHMQVSPEVSSLDPSAGIVVTGFAIPGLRSRKSQTVVEMQNGQNFVLSGLYNEDMTNQLNKTPLLGQIPIIGALFRSQAYRNAETEMVIVIHPEIVSDMNMSAVEAATRAAQAAPQSMPVVSSVNTISTIQPMKTTAGFPEVTDKPSRDLEKAQKQIDAQQKNLTAKDVKKQQKEMIKLSETLEKGKDSVKKHDKPVSNISAADDVKDASTTVQKAADTQAPQVFLAQQASQEARLKSTEDLSKLIREMEAPVAIEAPDDEPQYVPKTEAPAQPSGIKENPPAAAPAATTKPEPAKQTINEANAPASAQKNDKPAIKAKQVKRNTPQRVSRRYVAPQTPQKAVARESVQQIHKAVSSLLSLEQF